MAAVVQLKRSSTTLNLLNTSGLHVADVGWVPKIAALRDRFEPMVVEEVIEADLFGSSHDNVAVTMQALHDMEVWAAEYRRDSLTEHPVWLHAQTSDETSQRRAAVRRVASKWLSQHYSGEMIGSQPVVQIAVERQGAWEKTTASEMDNNISPGAAASVTYDYTATNGDDIIGDLPARIEQLEIRPAANDTLSKLWIGLRSANKHGTLTNFINVWECEDAGATLGTNAANGADATASDGNRTRITPGTATWAKRLTIELKDVSSNESDNFGRFLWLLRAQVSAGTWEIQFRYGYTQMADADFIEGPVKEWTNTTWGFRSQGIASIPLRDLRVLTTTLVTADVEGEWAIQVWARRTSGAGTLDIDCICPIPVDEGFFRAWGMSLTNAGGVPHRLIFSESPLGGKGCVAGVIGGSSYLEHVPPFEADNFRLPIGDGRMICVYEGSSGSVIGDQITFNAADQGYYYPRWLSLYGGEAP